MSRSIVTFPFSAPAPRPMHPLAIRPPRIIWGILLIGWLATLGWSAEQIGTLLLVFTTASQTPEQA